MSKTSSELRLDITVPDNYQHLKKLAEDDVNFVVKKDTTYAGSWRKRGGVGAAMMLARKWDRLENFLATHDKQYDIFDLILKSKDPEDILDDLKDLRCYLLLVESYVRRQMAEVEIQPVVSKSGRLEEQEVETSDPLKGYGGHYGY